MSRFHSVLGVLFVSLALGLVLERPLHSQDVTVEPQFVADEVLIKFRPDAAEGAKASVRAIVGAARKLRLRTAASGELELAALPARADVLAAAARLRQHPAVAFAEPNWIYTRQETSNDRFYTNGSLWGMYGDASTPANQFGSQAAEAWAAGHTGSSAVYVGVIDEGIDIDHPDLAANIWGNPHDWPDGQDNDGNGYADDLHGWDFVSNDNTVYDGYPGNYSIDSHGTHVAGTIGGAGNNGVGVAGVNWNVTIIAAKFLGPNGGTTANAVRALDYFADLKARHGLNIVATNNSWGGGGYSQALHEALIRSANAGILFVAAAGNSNRNNDAVQSYPSNYRTTIGTATHPAATYDAVIAVASITSGGAKSSFSSYGRTTVDLGAPGNDIVSTTPHNTYAFFSGTSMATPHVTGAAALYSVIFPGSTAAAIREGILAATTPTASLNGLTVTNGRLNIGNFAGSPPPPPTPPAAPGTLTATAVSASQINLAWADDSSNESGFTIERCTGAGCTAFAPLASVGAGATSFANTALAAGTTYRYRVQAFNAAGTSGYSPIAQATTASAPPPPTSERPLAPSDLVATPGPSAGRVSLAWSDNSNNETEFWIYRCLSSACSFSVIARVGTDVGSYVDSGLTPGTDYRYRVRAYNDAGTSPYSNLVVVTAP